LNIAGYFDPLLEWVNKATKEGFVSDKDHAIWIVSSDPVELLDKFEAFVPRPPVFNWDIKV
jgi:predicted Rossmann-fold nucleotide-binding protein